MRLPGLSALLITVATTLGALVPAPQPDDPSAVTRWLAQGGPRREGSPEEIRVFEALRGWFGPRVSVHESDFTGLDDEHSFSRRLWFRVPGTRPGELVVAVPTDAEGDRSLAWAVAWADQALRNPPGPTLVFLFTGAERGLGAQAGLGSRTFLDDYWPTVPAAVLYLDARPGDDLRFTAESGVFPSPLWMVQGLSTAARRAGVGAQIAGSAPSLFRFDLPSRRNALGPWFDRSIPGLWVSQGPEGAGPVQVFRAWTDGLAAGVPADWDRHYLTFDWGGVRFFWGQGFYLAVFLACAALLLFGYATLGRPRRGSLRYLTGGLWQLPVLLALGFLALWASTEVAQGLEAARGDPDLWQRLPLWVWTFKAAVTVSLYLVVLLPYRRSPFSQEPEFYAQAALLWLGATTLGAAAAELSFSFYFLWALVWGAVFIAFRSRVVRALALALGPVWLFKAAWDVLGPTPDLDLARWVVASPLQGNFVLAVLFFPFLLQIHSWHLAGDRHQHRHEGLRSVLGIGLWAVLALGLGLGVLRWPVDPGPIPVPTQVVDHTAGDALGSLWTTNLRHDTFLHRAVWDVEFRGQWPGESLELTVEADHPLTVYEANFPVVLAPEGTQARIVVGRQPPWPLHLRLTLPLDAGARLDVRAQLTGPRKYLVHDRLELVP